MAADRQVEGEAGRSRGFDGGQLPVGEELRDEVAALDERARHAGVDAGRAEGAEPGVTGDVGALRHEGVDPGGDVRVEVTGRLEQLAAAAGGEGGPVDQLALRRHRGRRQGRRRRGTTSFQCSRL
jgi:hypothetical protein